MRYSSNNAAQASCADKFPNGGRLFEPLTHNMADNVLIASRNVIQAGNNWFHMGVKRIAGNCIDTISVIHSLGLVKGLLLAQVHRVYAPTDF